MSRVDVQWSLHIHISGIVVVATMATACMASASPASKATAWRDVAMGGVEAPAQTLMNVSPRRDALRPLHSHHSSSPHASSPAPIKLNKTTVARQHAEVTECTCDRFCRYECAPYFSRTLPPPTPGQPNQQIRNLTVCVRPCCNSLDHKQSIFVLFSCFFIVLFY